MHEYAQYTATKTAGQSASVCTGKAPPAAPDRRHTTGRRQPPFFLIAATTRTVWTNGAVSSYHHHIIISSQHHHIIAAWCRIIGESSANHRRIITESPARRQGNTPRKEGGTIGGVIYIAK